MTAFLDPTLAKYLLLSLQLLGLLCAWLLRASEGSRGHVTCRCLFLLCFTAVAGAVVTSLMSNSSAWIISGTTLGMMVVATTYEPGSRRRAVV